MTRLLVHVEGQTEELFVAEVLRPYLLQRGYSHVSARILGNARQRSRRGGIKPWPSARREIVAHLKGDPACLATTMVDYYGLPQSPQEGWPARSAAGQLGTSDKGRCIEQALMEDVCQQMGKGFRAERFVPFVVVHEFEGLLFSDCAAFGRGVGRSDLTAPLQQIRDCFPSPEDIDDGPTTAPSKRVTQLLPGYEKPLFGVLSALEVGLEAIRTQCPHFRSWLETLEQRGQSPST